MIACPYNLAASFSVAYSTLHLTLLRALLSLTLLLTVQFVRAADTNNNGFSLDASPSVCISYDRETPCTMPLHLNWQGPRTNEVCLRELMKNPLLRCWQQQMNGSVDIEFSNASDVNYLLQEQVTGNTMVDTYVKVINRDLRDSRKRRRHVWSIF